MEREHKQPGDIVDTILTAVKASLVDTQNWWYKKARKNAVLQVIREKLAGYKQELTSVQIEQLLENNDDKYGLAFLKQERYFLGFSSNNDVPLADEKVTTDSAAINKGRALWRELGSDEGVDSWKELKNIIWNHHAKFAHLQQVSVIQTVLLQMSPIEVIKVQSLSKNFQKAAQKTLRNKNYQKKNSVDYCFFERANSDNRMAVRAKVPLNSITTKALYIYLQVALYYKIGEGLDTELAQKYSITFCSNNDNPCITFPVNEQKIPTVIEHLKKINAQCVIAQEDFILIKGPKRSVYSLKKEKLFLLCHEQIEHFMTFLALPFANKLDHFCQYIETYLPFVTCTVQRDKVEIQFPWDTESSKEIFNFLQNQQIKSTRGDNGFYYIDISQMIPLLSGTEEEEPILLAYVIYSLIDNRKDEPTEKSKCTIC